MFKILRETGGHTIVEWIREGDKTVKGAGVLYVMVKNINFISKGTGREMTYHSIWARSFICITSLSPQIKL